MNRTVTRATSTFLGAIGEAMRFEYARIWKDSAGREARGLLDAGTLKPVFQPVIFKLRLIELAQIFIESFIK